MTGFIDVQSHWIETPLGRLFARRWVTTDGGGRAQKPPIILFHDSLGCIELWRNFPDLLCQATGHEVIAYDRLGFGQSDRYPGALPPDFIRDEAVRFFALLKQELRVDRFIALGHSVGGAMAANVAFLHPQDCIGLITIAAQAFVEDRTVDGIRQAQVYFQQPGHLQRLEKYHGDKAPWVLSAWTDSWLSESFSGWTLEEQVERVECPLLALHGDQDEYGSSLHPARIARLSPQLGEYRILAGCHHVPHREAPEVVLEAVQGFLRGAGHR
ncbi:alpha/beta fold hydrolase [Pseudomonas sp. X10]